MDDAQKRHMLDVLKRHGISKITADFNGGCDSGQVDHIDCDGLVSKPQDHPYPPEWTAEYRHATSKNTFLDWLHDIVDDLLRETEYDWYNNDGGFGQVTIIPGNNYIHVDMNLNEMTSEHHPLDLSLPDVTLPPSGMVTPASNVPEELGAALTRLANQGLITPSHLDVFRHMETEATLQRMGREMEYAKLDAAKELGLEDEMHRLQEKAWAIIRKKNEESR